MKREFYGATIDAQQSINHLLSLPATGKEQDWEIEFADPSLIGNILQAALSQTMDHDQRCALYLLLIASIVEGKELGRLEDGSIEEARALLKQDNDVREAMIFYWIDQSRSSDDELMTRLLRS